MVDKNKTLEIFGSKGGLTSIRKGLPLTLGVTRKKGRNTNVGVVSHALAIGVLRVGDASGYVLCVRATEVSVSPLVCLSGVALPPA